MRKIRLTKPTTKIATTGLPSKGVVKKASDIRERVISNRKKNGLYVKPVKSPSANKGGCGGCRRRRAKK